MTVKGMSAIRSPNRPPMPNRAAKASVIVIIAENTGPIIRRAAFSAARTGGSPSRLTRKSAYSLTTMASSTTIPSIRIMANSDIMLIESPPRYMTAIPAAVATGIPAATQIAVRALRNRNSIRTTSTSP